MPWNAIRACPQTLRVRSQRFSARLAHRNCLRSETLQIHRSCWTPFDVGINLTRKACDAQRIKNSCGAERSGVATQFYVELSRLPGNLEFNQEGLLLQE